MNNSKTNYIAKIGVLSALAALIMLFEFPLWFAPSFYELDLSDLCALVGSFALGPLAGVLIQLLKNILNIFLTGTPTLTVGEISNFIVGCSFVLPASIIYKYNRTRKGAIIGMIVGTIVLASAGSLVNLYILIPTYVKVANLPLEQIVQMGNAVNKNITSLNTLILYAVIPFNLLKGIIISVITSLIYKKISKLLKK